MGKWMRILPVLGLIVPLLGCAKAAVDAPAAPPLRLRTTAEPVRATIFDPITVTVRLDFADGVAPELPDAPPIPAGLEKDDAQTEGPTPNGNRTVLAQKYTFHATEAGAYVFPEIVVPYTLPDGTHAEAKSARLFLDVQPSLTGAANDLADLRDIEGPVPVPRDMGLFYAVLAAIVLGAALGAGLLWFWLKHRKPEEQPVVVRPPHKEALIALAQLERSGLIEQGEIREYLFGLSEVFCAYLEGRFSVPALASTSEQLLPMLAEQPALPMETGILVKRFVSDTDPVKYAEAPATSDLATQWTGEIRRYVEMTAPDESLERAA